MVLQNTSPSSPSDSSQNKPSKGHMPPGMIMGPDGKPCKICTAFRHWKPETTGHTEANREPKTWPAPNAGQRQKTYNADWPLSGFAALVGAPAPSTPGSSTSTSPSRSDEPPPGCPPDAEQLGRATWTFLHTTAAYYPEKPTPTQRANMLMLLRSLPILYPCTWCAEDFGKDIEKTPPIVSGRTALSRWLCERHNEVNEKLGKQKFDCLKVDERWKDGPVDGRCD